MRLVPRDLIVQDSNFAPIVDQFVVVDPDHSKPEEDM